MFKGRGTADMFSYFRSGTEGIPQKSLSGRMLLSLCSGNLNITQLTKDKHGRLFTDNVSS